MFILDKSSLKDRIKDDMKKMWSKDDERHEESRHHSHEKDHHHHHHHHHEMDRHNRHEKNHHHHKDINDLKKDLKSDILGDVADKMGKINSIFDRDHGISIIMIIHSDVK